MASGKGGNPTRKKGHKGTRKHRRNYRWGDPPVEHGTTKYRSRNHIGKDERRSKAV